MKITFFGTQPYDRESFDRANASCGFEFNYHRSHLNGNNALLAQGADAVCIFVNDTADAGTIRQLAAMGVKLIALRCAGFNNVDLKAAAEYGIPVVRVPAYSPHAVAEHAVALMLALNRKVHRAYWRTRDGNFSLHGLMGFDMYGKTAGIVGTGKIARELIRILKGFGMKVLAYDIFPDAEYAAQAQVEYVTLDELYRRADIISLHCPLTDQTRYMINGDAIGKMKPGVILINTGRGQLIHTEALIEGLKEKKIGAAGLDVYEEEAAYFYEDTSDRIMDDDILARLLRHGESTWNRENRFTGWTDVDLSEKGVAEAARAGELLRKEGFLFGHAYTSYLKRAVKTLDVVLDKLDQDWIPVSKSWRLNEKHYGMLQGLNKRETAEKYGDEQVHIWRRSYDVAPAPLGEEDPRNPRFDPRYRDVPEAELPRTESLSDTVARIMPYWKCEILPALAHHDAILVVAHGNSLRGIIKHLKGISDEAISEFNLPTAVPYVFEFDEGLNYAGDRFLGDPDEIARLMAAVADQGRKG